MGDRQMNNEKKEKIKKNKNGKINKKNIYKNNGERGSITVLVLTSLLFFIMFFMTMYAKNTNKISSQEREIKEIEKAYNEDIEMEYSKKIAEISNQSISNDVSYVGKYADIDDNGTIDGIIFADLAIGNTVPGNFGNQDGAYTIPKMTGLKEYYVKKTEKDRRWDINTAKEVIAPKEGTSGKDRFYVMELEDLKLNNKSTFTWNKAYDNSSFNTSLKFGTGETNTKELMSKPFQIDVDIWKSSVLIEKRPKWFVPSREEWAAFANELNIGKSGSKNSYVNHNLERWYWSSSQFNRSNAWYADFIDGCMSGGNVPIAGPVRLAATF